ncbi:MAG: VWA domain-containing protein [Methanomicrobiales archaeon]|nr:VWA domain-containing protein [Methanomicrobiales archaeon]
MRRLCLLLVGIFILAGAAAALDPVNVAVRSSAISVTADNTDTVEITVTVTDGVNKGISKADVLLSVSAPWALLATGGTTAGDGKFATLLLPTTKAGTAVITATVEVPGVTTAPVVQTFSQEIVATTAVKATSSYQTTGSVGAITDITIRVTDQYGNPVTSRIKKNSIDFTTTLLGENAFLTSASSKTKVKALSVALNDSGYVDVDFVLNTRPGANYVVVSPPYPLPDTLIRIDGVANLPPAIITKTVTPAGNPPTIKSDNRSTFTLNYALYDLYGNPSAGRKLSIFSSADESRVVTSNSEGKVTITYGPKSQAGRYIIVAQAFDNPSLSSAQTLQFLSGKATNMLLTASPQTMASLDVKKDMEAWVTAKVIDANGNPVAGETVSFSLVSVNTGAFNQTKSPVIESGKTKTDMLNTPIAVVSDENGLATLSFYPGAFVADAKEAGFSPLAEGTAKVQARWSTVSRTIDLAYKNFPYLSVYTSASPGTLEVDDLLDVSIRIRGDGFALQPRPVDVLMVTDRSGSMLWDYPDRMILVMGAARTFASKFDYKNDRLGQISFGADYEVMASDNIWCGDDDDWDDDWDYAKKYYDEDGKTYDDYATLDLALSGTENDVNKAIDGLVPTGWTPMRYALYKAINELREKGNPNSVKALVVLSDGDYNYYGDPLARGSAGSSDPSAYKDLDRNYVKFTGLVSQNMAAYAKANNIRIYCIGYSASLSEGGRATLEQLAIQTGGKYYYALTGDDLTNFYVQIAGALKDTAGVNTNLAMDFSSVEVNGTSITPGTDVLKYLPLTGRSTHVTGPSGSYDINNKDDWEKGKLNVSLGTIKVNQEYIVNFTLQMLMEGNIRIADSGRSRVYFDDDQAYVPTPDAYITALPIGRDKGFSTPTLLVSNLVRTNENTDRKTAALSWEISYNGMDAEIREEIEVAPLHSEAYSYRATTYADNDRTSDTKSIDISDLQPGVYKARVTGIVSDADSSFTITQFSVLTLPPKTEIVIQ